MVRPFLAAASLFLGLFLFIANRHTLAETGMPNPVLVELFTSEGCSSCPPADALLIRLEKLQPVPNARIIVLSQHVDYWNQLGWADPFSSALFSRRQSEYADAFGRDGIYTPQMVVDGQAEFVGSDAARAQQAIARAAAQPKAMVSVAFSEGAAADLGNIRVALAALPANLPIENADLLVAITEANLSSNVSRGENAGRSIQHTGVVRLLKSLGRAERSQASYEENVKLPAAWQRKNLMAVAILQDRKTRRILGAGVAPWAGK